MSIPARLDEAHGVEGDLPDETVVGYHHGHGAEQSLGVEVGGGAGAEQTEVNTHFRRRGRMT